MTEEEEEEEDSEEEEGIEENIQIDIKNNTNKTIFADYILGIPIKRGGL